MASQDLQKSRRHHKGNGQKFRRFIGGIAVHDALITGTAFIHAKRDVRRLLLHHNDEIRELRIAETLPADAVKDLLDQFPIIRRMAAGQLTGNYQLVVFHQAFDGHTGSGIVLQAIRHDGICNLIAQLVRMAIGHLLTSKNSHFIPSFHGKSPGRKIPPRLLRGFS